MKPTVIMKSDSKKTVNKNELSAKPTAIPIAIIPKIKLKVPIKSNVNQFMLFNS